MKAMILAAGRGERMLPLTKETPKPLLEVAGVSLLERHLIRLADADFDEIVINVSHLGEQIVSFCGDGSRWGVSISFSREPEPLETAGGIAHALPQLGDQPFLVVNGDIFTDFPFEKLKGVMPTEAGAHLVLVPNPSHHPGGDFNLTGLASDQSGSPMGRLSMTSGRDTMLTYSGIGVYSPQMFEQVPEGLPASAAIGGGLCRRSREWPTLRGSVGGYWYTRAAGCTQSVTDHSILTRASDKLRVVSSRDAHDMSDYLIAPSILAADFARLGEEVDTVLQAGADLIHFDVMDNHYVPNLTIGPMVCEALRRHGVTAPIDVHLMVQPVDGLIANFADAGASYITFHPDASIHVDRSLQLIRDAGCLSGLVLNPATGLESIRYALDKVDMILLMSVNPGFGGQKFIPSTLDKIREVRALIDASGRDIRLEVDGGIGPDNIAEIAAAGADTFVAGSAIFGQPDYAAVIGSMRQALADL